MTELGENKTYSFSGFELDARRRTLSKDGNSIPLNSKTFDLLLTLVEHRGKVLSKDELLDKVWAGQFVEENNLTVHISALRKILGEKKGENRFLVTVPGKGYKWVADFDEGRENEIVIENHSFSRIVVEETEEAETQPGQLTGKRRLAITVSSAIAVLTTVLLTAAATLWLYNSSNQNAGGRKTSVHAAEKTFVPKLFRRNG